MLGALLLCFVIPVVLGSLLPAEVKLCHRSDPEFQSCLAKNIQDGLYYFLKGNKELGIPKLEPFFVKKIEIKGNTGGSISLDQKYENVKMYGGVWPLDVSRYLNLNLEGKCTWEFDTFSPILRMEADYEVKGQLLVFPIDAHGKCNITQYNVLNENRATCEMYTKGGETYMNITSYTMNLKTEKITYDFEDLFPGEERISAEILRSLNEHGKEIFNELKNGFELAMALIYKNVINNVFSKVPIKDLFLD